MRNNAPMLKAGGTIAPTSFVKISAVADRTVLQAAANTTVTIGISQVGMKRMPGLAGSDTTIAAEAGDQIEICSLGDVCLLTIGAGGCTAGDMLTPGASGAGITSAVGAGNQVGAIALETVAANAQALVQIINRVS